MCKESVAKQGIRIATDHVRFEAVKSVILWCNFEGLAESYHLIFVAKMPTCVILYVHQHACAHF